MIGFFCHDGEARVSHYPAKATMRTRSWNRCLLLVLMMASVAVVVQPLLAEPFVHDPNFGIELYATAPSGLDGLAFTSGGRFSRGLYATIASEHSIYHISDSGSASLFATDLPFHNYEPAFDPSGAFGGDLYVAAIHSYYGPGDKIMRVTPDGTVTTFYSSGYNQLDHLGRGLAFSPAGSAFGTYLYIPDSEHGSVSFIDPGGVRDGMGSIPMASLDRKDIEFSRGGSWGTHAFINDSDSREIFRLAPDGTCTVFFTQPSDAPKLRSIAFGDGGLFGNDLFAGGDDGLLYRIDESGGV